MATIILDSPVEGLNVGDEYDGPRAAWHVVEGNGHYKAKRSRVDYADQTYVKPGDDPTLAENREDDEPSESLSSYLARTSDKDALRKEQAEARDAEGDLPESVDEPSGQSPPTGGGINPAHDSGRKPEPDTGQGALQDPKAEKPSKDKSAEVTESTED